MMKLFVTRHGQTNYNVLGLCNDDPEKDVFLTPKGIQQAEELASALSGEAIDVIFVSEFFRTRQTAEIINKTHNVKIQVDRRLNDRKTGFDGKSSSEYKKSLPWYKPHSKVKGGESFLEQESRLKSFLEDLKKTSYKSVLIVGHSEPLRVLLGVTNNLSNWEILKMRFRNCELIKTNLKPSHAEKATT